MSSLSAIADELKLSAQFRHRRFLNWFPLGLAYAFLYMGRYSFIPAKEELPNFINSHVHGIAGTAGAITYGVSFLLNGVLSEKWGGRVGMLIATAGSAVINMLLGFLVVNREAVGAEGFLLPYAGLMAVNMYFQSFAAIAIVKVNGAWFHVRERGRFGGIFGIMISSGLFLAYTVSPMIMLYLIKGHPEGYFFVPGGLLVLLFVATWLFIRDTPEDAGLGYFETGSSKDFDDAEKISIFQVFKKLFSHPIVMTIALMELCTGVLRDGMNYWFGAWAKQSALPDIRAYLGIFLFAAGVFGGLTAGYLSDKVFQSRRAPVAGMLYAIMIVLTAALFGAIVGLPNDSKVLPVIVLGIVVVGAMCVIGTHGVLSGAATADFGGKKATGLVVGIIDGFVYLGVGLQSISLGYLTPKGWTYWGLFLFPFAIIGLYLSTRIWHALPKRGGGGH
jgi:OPA family glycerol-3-phosphate transporter-like MFS transporter